MVVKICNYFANYCFWTKCRIMPIVEINYVIYGAIIDSFIFIAK